MAKRKKKLPPSAKETSLIDSSDDDQPLGAKLAQKKASVEKAAAKEAKAIRAESNAKKAAAKRALKEESEDEPLAKPKKRQSNGVSATPATKRNGVKKAESDSDEPIAKKAKITPVGKAKAGAKTATAPVKKAAASTPKPKKQVKSEEPEDGEEGEEDEEHRWWEGPKKEDDSIKWTTLEHNGVIFAPAYEPLPKHVKLHYDGKPVDLHVNAEEVATFFGSMLNSALHVENPVFQKNFFTDFKEVLQKTGGAKDNKGNKVDIKDFSKLDFKAMYEYYKAKSDAKKSRPSSEKKAEKAEKDALEAPYIFCKWDGRKEKVGNFRVEPPGLFRGRGEHPKTGKVKKRVMPEQVTINIGKGAKVPDPPPGHKWKAVQHDNRATWLAMWQENINGNYKYVMLSANSAIKGQADHKKFEKARDLKKHIDRIRTDYSRELKSDVMADRQRATAMYLIDKFALRAGNEKDTENEAETVGCCSLKFEHITLREPNTVVFDFLGKDSIRFYNEVAVDRQVFRNLRMFKKPPKVDGDDIFDRLNVSLSFEKEKKVRRGEETRKLTAIDVPIEQASIQLYGWTDCQGLPYLQCLVHHVQAPPRTALGQGYHGGREDQALQRLQPGGRHSMQPQADSRRSPRDPDGEAWGSHQGTAIPELADQDDDVGCRSQTEEEEGSRVLQSRRRH